MNKQPWIKFEAAEVRVKQKVLLEHVNFEIQRGEMIAVLGPNGAGKSTLAKALLGIQPLASGAILMDGVPVKNLSRSEMAGVIAYVPQLLAIEIPFTVRDFVKMGCYRLDGKDEDSDSLVIEAMDRVEVGQLAERVVSTLSGGERQRVCIAAALAQNTPMLLLDEPLAHLDPGQRIEVQRVIRQLRGDKTVLAITHDLTWARNDFDRVIGLMAGKVVYDGGADRLSILDVAKMLFGEGVSELLKGERRG